MSAGSYNALLAPQQAPQPEQQPQRVTPFVRYLQQLSAQQNLHRAPMQQLGPALPLSRVQPELPQWQPAQQGAPPQWQQMFALSQNRLANPNDPNLNMMSMLMGMQTPEQQSEEIPT